MIWDAVRFCIDYRIPYTLPGNSVGKVTPGWIGIQCPNSNCDSRHKENYGGFNLHKGYFNCWNCGGHPLGLVVSWLLGVSLSEAESILATYRSEPSNFAFSPQSRVKYASKIKVPGEGLFDAHKQYLEKRRFSPQWAVENYGITAVPGVSYKPEDRGFENRIIIPLYDARGKVISFQGRDITDKHNLRYKGCPNIRSVMNYKHTLYADNTVPGQQVGVVEGIFDQWRLGAGFVATYGLALTKWQIKALSKYRKIFFLFDSEDTAQKKAEHYGYELAGLGCEVETIQIDADDPDDLEEGEVSELREMLKF